VRYEVVRFSARKSALVRATGAGAVPSVGRVADVIRELRILERGAKKLGARGISDREAQQIVDNRYAIASNRRGSRRGRRAAGGRRLLIGRTDGGRALTLVVERTLEPTTWIVVTGWSSSERERKMLGG
jgi:hypothetical protein